MNKKVVKFILLIIIFFTFSNVCLAEELLPLRKIVEDNNGIVKWEDKEKSIDIIFMDKKIKLWIDKNTYIINSEEKELDYSPLLKDGQTVLPIVFFKDILKINDFYKYSNRYNINYTVKTEPELMWDTGKYITTPIVDGKQTVTPEEIIDKIKEIMSYIEENTFVKMELNDMEVKIYPLLERDDYMASVNSKPDGKGGYYKHNIDFYRLDTEDYLSIVAHEIGHYIENKYIDEKEFEEYLKFRGLDLKYFNSETWGRTPTEVFAEDFRNIFYPTHINETHANTLTKEQLEEFKTFLFINIQNSQLVL